MSDISLASLVWGGFSFIAACFNHDPTQTMILALFSGACVVYGLMQGGDSKMEHKD